jgi:hypothetical protein
MMIIRQQNARTSHGEWGSMMAKSKRSKEKLPQETPYGQKRTVAIEVGRTPLNH